MKIGNKILIVVIAVIGLYAAFLIYSDINTISSKISDFKIEIIPIILLLVTSGWFVLFFRWYLLLRNAKIFIPVKDSFLIFMSGFALTIIPGKVGELVKSQLLKTKFGIARSKTSSHSNLRAILFSYWHNNTIIFWNMVFRIRSICTWVFYGCAGFCFCFAFIKKSI